jgi:glyoxylase-like metal-dependent hydrolase (beta-lactamase superfamily II)
MAQAKVRETGMPLFRDEGILREHVIQVVPDVYQITFRAANVLLIVEDQLTLVDTGYGSTVPRVIEFVRSLNRKPEELRLIVLTHCHFDHAGGLRELKKLTGAKVACHRADISDSELLAPYPRPVQKALELRPLAGIRSQLGVSSSEVELQLHGGETLPVLGGLRVVHTPGHTPGSICLLAPKHKMLIAGDALTRRGQTIALAPKSISTDQAEAARSVRVLIREDFDKICFGHHAPMIGDAKARLRELAAKIRLRSKRRRTAPFPRGRATSQDGRTSSP